jgi:serine/threonine-protein kinase
MVRPFPIPQDKYPVLYLKDTDGPLPKHVVNNKIRYGYFKTIAKGGKCVIQSCKDFHLSRVVAYKSLRPELANDPNENQRFLREARVTAMLQHPNTVPVYELSRDNSGHYYFTMKLVMGSTLREILNGTAEMKGWDGAPLRRLTDTLIQVCHALDYAHNHGVVHRDVKPANILVGPFGEVLLLDWGLAKVWGMDDEQDPPIEPVVQTTLTGQGKLQGTVLYMSPEQIEESVDLDHRSDVYSLGAVLYEVLTGVEMITGSSLHALMNAVVGSDIVPPSERAPERDIPEALEEICLRCVARDPEERFASAYDLLMALQAWSEGVDADLS